jgi:hypothetical protein
VNDTALISILYVPWSKHKYHNISEGYRLVYFTFMSNLETILEECKLV